MEQVWKKGQDLRHRKAYMPISRRRPPPKNLTSAKNLGHLRHPITPLPRELPIDLSCRAPRLSDHPGDGFLLQSEATGKLRD